jgi:peptidoglycan/xylan/chitin deacetylase (PgdA/CDA1 family)
MEILKRLFLHSNESRRDLPGYEYTRKGLKERGNIQFLEVADIHVAGTIEFVKTFAPCLGLSLASPILRQSLFSIPKLGTLNLHKGKVPDYRGMPPAFWEMWNGENTVGCTVHWVEARLDTGNVVRETSVARQKHSTVRGLQLLLDETGIKLMLEAVRDVLNGTVKSVPQPKGGHTYRKPTLAQIMHLERKIEREQLVPESSPKRILKAIYYSLKIWFRRFLWQRILKRKVVVLLYHRVSDDARDNLTVGIEQFDRQMAMVRRHCHVVSIEQMLNGGAAQPARKPIVCVTFDDGYRDNYDHAVPILLRHQVPASFFVCTDIIGTNRALPHDLRRGNPPIPTMNWEQLRKIHACGFTVGSHTANHINCAAESEEKVKAELTEAHKRLHSELKMQDVIFAYPYGGLDNMTPERLELVKQAGYTACLSAYGGVNTGKLNRFNILRSGIHWEFSDLAFLYQCYRTK